MSTQPGKEQAGLEVAGGRGKGRIVYQAERQELILARRNLANIPTDIVASYAHRTEYLDVSHNRFENFDWLVRFEHLKYLILDNNRLREAHLRLLPPRPPATIKVLTLNNNELIDLFAMVSLLAEKFPNLEYLSLLGNPLCPADTTPSSCSGGLASGNLIAYRNHIIAAMPRLKFLDQPAGAAKVRVVAAPTEAAMPSNLLTATPKMLWLKLRGSRPVLDYNPLCEQQPQAATAGRHSGTVRQLSAGEQRYSGHHSEGNRYISNEDL